ncbi:hypothetical protein Btru_077359 [Bulinus truncatus]|nr:hypothetical protein Btru_077359 [Bulinus truncatus]
MNLTSPIVAEDIIPVALVNPSVLKAVLTLNFVICNEVVGFCGIAANFLNLWNFKRQGFQDGVNVTLFALALGDMGALVAQQFTNVFANPWIGETDLFMVKSHLLTIAVYVQWYFVRFGGLVTAFATLERCLCVVWPLKVKRIITKNVALAVNLGLLSVVFLYLIPVYCTFTIGWTFLPERNRSILSVKFSSNRDSVFAWYYLVADTALPYATGLVLTTCTTVIVTRLGSSLKWRQAASTTSGSRDSDAVIYKERKLTSMLVIIAVIFIVCIIPHSAMSAALSLVRELKMGGQYFDVLMVCYSVTSLLETINCSVTILVYYRMSSRGSGYGPQARVGPGKDSAEQNDVITFCVLAAFRTHGHQPRGSTRVHVKETHFLDGEVILSQYVLTCNEATCLIV